MDMNNLSVFALANQNMQYLTERQRVLATNVANANTPNYLPKDIEGPSFANVLSSSLKMTVTNEKHLSGLGSSASEFKVYTPKPTQPLTIDGNGVVLEEQLNEISKDKGEYSRMLAIYGKYKNMLSTANTKINI